MKLRLHHIEMCVTHPEKIVNVLRDQFGLSLVGRRETPLCNQLVVQMEKLIFVITKRNYSNDLKVYQNISENIPNKVADEPWTIFCCETYNPMEHVDSVFNIALEVENLSKCLEKISHMGGEIIKNVVQISFKHGYVKYAIVKSCCGDVVHTLIEKKEYNEWFLPGFTEIRANNSVSPVESISMTHFDHVALACRVGETNEIIKWYEKAFDMKRFITNRQDSDEDGLMIGDDVGMRLKVMEFWKCSESGLASSSSNSQEDSWEPLKIVVAESLPNISNTQIENFIRDHDGPGLQHVGLHTSHMVETVGSMFKKGVKFRQPPPTYYTEVGQLDVINSVGEDVGLLSKYGVLLDDEADVFNEQEDQLNPETMYLMQIFTYPIFDRDTFFLEIIQRKGARGFGVGNVTALARSVNAYNLKLKQEKEQSKMNAGIN